MAEPAQLRNLANTGTQPVDVVRVDFITAGSDETWGRTGMPPNYKLLFENRYSRS